MLGSVVNECQNFAVIFGAGGGLGEELMVAPTASIATWLPGYGEKLMGEISGARGGTLWGNRRCQTRSPAGVASDML